MLACMHMTCLQHVAMYAEMQLSHHTCMYVMLVTHSILLSALKMGRMVSPVYFFPVNGLSSEAHCIALVVTQALYVLLDLAV